MATHSTKSPKKSRKSAATSDAVSLTAVASKAAVSLGSLANTLPLDDSMSPEDVKASRGSTRVPNSLILLAAQVVASDPTRFPDIDPEQAREAVAYETALGPIGQDALVLATRIQKSIQKKRGAAASQTLATYAILKGLARVPGNEASSGHLKQMKEVLATRKSKRSLKVTQAEAQTLVKAAKAVKVANSDFAAVQSAAKKASGSLSAATNTAADATSLLQAAGSAQPAPAVAVTPVATASASAVTVTP